MIMPDGYLERNGMPFREPDEGPNTGSCWNCTHMVEITIGSKSYWFCMVNRDVSASGDVREVDESMSECLDWNEYGA